MNEHEHRDHVHYRPDWLGTLPGLRTAAPWQTELSFTLPYEDQAYVMSLFHGGPRWLWEVRLAWGRCTTPPISRGTAWRTGADAACQHQLTEPPEPARWHIGTLPQLPWPRWAIAWMIQQLREDPDLFNPARWRDDVPDLPDVARDYPPPAEPCAECVAATTPMRTWVQQWWLRFAELLTYSHANQPPRTDFMPQYPGIGNQTGR